MTEDQPITIYLLHFDEPVGRFEHYLGSTATENRFRRWRDHAAGRAAKLTARAAERGIGFTVSRQWPSAARDTEKRLKKAGHFRSLCPICERPMLAAMEAFPQYRSTHPKWVARRDLEPWEPVAPPPALET